MIYSEQVNRGLFPLIWLVLSNQVCILGVNVQWWKAFSAVRSTHHVSKQIKTMSKYFSVQLIFGNGCLNLRDLNGLNFPPKNSHIAHRHQKFLKKNH